MFIYSLFSMHGIKNPRGFLYSVLKKKTELMSKLDLGLSEAACRPPPPSFPAHRKHWRDAEGDTGAPALGAIGSYF